MIRLNSLAIIIVLGAMILHACSTQPVHDPIAVMIDTDASYAARRSAAKQAFETERHDPAFFTALHKIVFSPGYPPWQRMDAVDMWVEADEKRFRQSLAVHVMSVPDWQTLDHIFDVVIESQWDDFLPLAVRLYARPDSLYVDIERPERRVISALRPNQTIEESIFEAFSGVQGRSTVVQQAAAWDLLWRLSNESAIRSMLDHAEPSILVNDLRAARDDLGILPRSREELLWLMTLREPGRSGKWKDMTERIAMLRDEQKVGLELRHLRVLMEWDEEKIDMDRSMLLAEIGSRIGRAERHFKNEADAESHTFAANVDEMNWADLAVLYFLVDALSQGKVASAIFEQAEADLNDTSTEYGGVMDRFMQEYTCNLYKPVLKRGDDVFIPSQSMINHAYSGLFHYHFHCQSYRNADHAGPGTGDLAVASRMRFNFIVFTFIDKNRLNADYYQPNGIVIDLGTVYRPRVDDPRFRAVEVDANRGE